MLLRRLLLFTAAVVLLMPPSSLAQDKSIPSFEWFGAYSQYKTTSTNANFKRDFSSGFATQLNFNAGRFGGVVIDVSRSTNSQGNVYSLALGPQLKYRIGPLTPFGELMIGMQRFSSTQAGTQNVGIVGAGLDLRLTRQLSLRPLQVDYVAPLFNTVHASSGPDGIRRQAGVILTFGNSRSSTATLSKDEAVALCAGDPSSLVAGTPVTVTVSVTGFDPKRLISYSYTTTGGVLNPNKSSASLNTAGLAPGKYVVTAKAFNRGRRSHRQSAICETSFSVNEAPKRPPVLSITSETTSITSGATSAITLVGSSPDNRTLTYACAASAGRLSGSGPDLTLDTAGVTDRSIEITCTARDDRDLTASATLSLHVTPSAPPINAHKFGKISFKHDVKRPTRVDNEAKGQLDRFGDALTAAPDTKAVVVGNATAAEAQATTKDAPQVAAQRAVNTKDYLVKGKGIDPARIETRVGSDKDKDVQLWIAPPGASVSVANTLAVDESTIKSIPRVPLPMRKHSYSKVASAHRATSAHKVASTRKTGPKTGPAHKTAHKTASAHKPHVHRSHA